MKSSKEGRGNKKQKGRGAELLYLSVYNVHFFLTHFAFKIKMYIIHKTLFPYELICITTQKYYIVKQLPVL